MNGIRPARLRHTDNLGDRQIGRDRAQPLADAIGLVSLEAMEGELVLFGIDGHRLLAEFSRRTHDTDGDFTAIGDQDLGKHLLQPL